MCRLSQVSRSRPAPDARVGKLRQVDVEVDHARHDDHGPQIDGRRGRVRIGVIRGGSHPGETAGDVDVDEPIEFVRGPTVGLGRQKARADREGGIRRERQHRLHGPRC